MGDFLKKIFILAYIPTVFFVFFLLLTDIYGSPFYIVLTKKRAEEYLGNHYTTMTIEDVIFDGDYTAIVSDRFGDKFEMIYDPKTDTIEDHYYLDTVEVMKGLYRNNIRKMIKINDVDINSDNISIDLSIPKYIFELGDLGSGDDCFADIWISLDDIYSSKMDFCEDAFLIFKSLRYFPLELNSINITALGENGRYIVEANDRIYPADVGTTSLITILKEEKLSGDH